MCGISGWVLPTTAEFGKRELGEMCDEISHRGPDDSGEFVAQTDRGTHNIFLGHRRLSIIDLATGSQPMASSDGSCVISFNGEIYNYVELRKALREKGSEFKTNSDTEVILQSYRVWGDDFVHHLRGQFAFAIWDAVGERLVLARDHFGLKPLYYLQTEGGLIFSSEIKSILKVVKEKSVPDRDSIWTYHRYRYVPGPRTMFEGIRKLQPGNIAIWDGINGLTIKRYFETFDSKLRSGGDSNVFLVERFMEKLEESVRLRMSSDVPFGAFLSGGIDSSSIVALMSMNNEVPVNTFSVGFSEAEYSELDYSRKVSDLFGCNHHELIINPDDLIEHLPTLIRFRDSPVSEPSDIPIYLLSKEASKYVKMVLTGEGSDEIIGGYEKHFLESPSSIYRSFVPNIIHRKLLEPIVRSLPYKNQRWKTAMYCVGLRERGDRLSRWFGALSKGERGRLCRDGGWMDVDLPVDYQVESGNSHLRHSLHFDQTKWLPDNLLERGDRMTMAASIEARMPFMDVELARFVSSIPDRERVKWKDTKRILRKGMRGLIPDDILNRKKIGFRVPVNEWFRGPLHDWLRNTLTGPDSTTLEYYDISLLEKYLDEHSKGKQNHEKLLWSLLSLELFHKEYFPNN